MLTRSIKSQLHYYGEPLQVTHKHFSFPSPIQYQGASLLLLTPPCPAKSLGHMLDGEPSGLSGGFSASHGAWVCRSSTPPPVICSPAVRRYHPSLFSTQVYNLFLFIIFFHHPTYCPAPMFSSLFPVLLHAHLNIMFPTPFLRQTQPVLVLLMQLLRYKWPCSPKLPLSYAVHAGQT